MSFRAASARGCAPCQTKREFFFVANSKNDGRRGAFEHDPPRHISRAIQETFPERGCILEHQAFRLAKVNLRVRCSTSHDLASLFRGRRTTLDTWNGKFTKRIGTRPSALHSTFHFCRKSRMTQVDQSWALFEQQAFNATGEDHFLESKKPMCLRPRK